MPTPAWSPPDDLLRIAIVERLTAGPLAERLGVCEETVQPHYARLGVCSLRRRLLEDEVAELRAEGFTYRQISDRLSLGGHSFAQRVLARRERREAERTEFVEELEAEGLPVVWLPPQKAAEFDRVFA